MVFPEYGAGYKCKVTLPSILDERALERLRADHRVAVGHAPDVAHDAGGLSAADRRNELQAARPEDDRVLPRGPAQLRRGRHAEPARVRSGVLREAWRRRRGLKPIAHLYKTQVYALAEYLGVPDEIRRRPPTTETFSLPQTQEEFYFSVPYAQMDLCLYGRNHDVPAAEVADAAALTRRAGGAHLSRTSIRSGGRRATSMRGRTGRVGRRDSFLMCGIAGVVSLRPGLPPIAIDDLPG